MATYFAFDYAGGRFVLFGAAHLGTLLAFAALAAGVIRSGRRADAAARARMRRLLAVVLLVNELSWHAWNLAFGEWRPGHMLPLHLCSVMIWYSVFVLWTGRRELFAPIYFLGIVGAVQALLTPDAGLYGFPHFRFFQTMIAHGGLVLAGLWVVLVERHAPSRREYLGVLAALNVYALLVYFVNRAVGSNYLYVNGKPASASLLDLMPAWPWYIPILEVLAVVLLGLMWWPFRPRPTPSRDRVRTAS